MQTAALIPAMLLATLCAHAGDPERPSDAVTIIDVDGGTIRITAEELRAMPQHTEKEVIFVGERVGFIGIFDFTGVRLTDLLEKAPAAQGAGAYKKRNLYLILRGTDGYQTVVSWKELANTPAGQRALLALEQDGEALPRTEGAVRSLFPGDKYCGRSIKCLETIEIHVVAGVVEKPQEDAKPAADR